MGAWLSYGLGKLNENVPAFVVLPDSRGLPYNGQGSFSSGFLPAAHQGTMIRVGRPNPIHDLFPSESSKFITRESEAESLKVLRELNQAHLATREGDSRLEARIRSYEMAASLAPDLGPSNHDITQAYLNRGYIRSNRMDIEGALADFDHAIKYDPNDAEAYFKRGRAFLIIGNAKFAIADFDKSISLDDHNPLVFAERGYARQTQGMKSEAQKDFERGLKLNNDLRLMLDLHLLDLQMQIKEMERRLSAIKRNIA